MHCCNKVSGDARLTNTSLNTKVKSCKFLYSRNKFEDSSLPEICMVGRSNAGKSSLINMLARQKNLAKSSSSPGRTRLINYFELNLQVDETNDNLVDDIGIVKLSDRCENELEQQHKRVDLSGSASNATKLLLVDLPGYGFSVASKSQREIWDGLIDTYLTQSSNLKMCFLLIDSRHSPMANDLHAAQYLYSLNVPFSIIGAKVDKLSKRQANQCVDTIANGFKVGRDNIAITSAITGQGRQALLDKIYLVCKD